MTFYEWAMDTAAHVREDGVDGMKRSAYEFYLGVHRRLDNAFRFGTHIYEADWDVLVVLDACRADLMTEVAPDYGFTDVQRTYSIAGGSKSWMERTFVEQYREQIDNTVYVTGNPFSDEVLTGNSFLPDEGGFARLNEVWKHRWDDELNTVPARAITDVSISEWRDRDASRLIAHYMQPHHPFVPDPMDDGMNRHDNANPDRPVWERLAAGEVTHERTWRAYRDNLRHVLDDLEILLTNIDADEVIVTSDHGNAFGEYWMYGHGDSPIPAIRRVPLIETTASRTSDYEPELDTRETDLSVQERLEHLGYM